MADNMNLQISIEGVNGTGSTFEQVDAAIASVQEALNSLSRASQSASETISRMGQAGGEAGRAMESGLVAAQQGLRNTSDAAGGLNSSVDRLGQAISAEMIGEQLKQIGESGMKAFESCVESAADFEYNISRIGAVLTTVGKATNQQMGQMSEDALKIGSTSSFSANQIAEGMYTLARQGLDASTILGDGVNGAINIVNDLAQATDSSMTDTATVITDVVHEYGLSGNSLREVANIMSGALHNSSESLDDFYQSMKQVGPIAANMHQNVNDMSTALALLAQHGITGSSAGTALKNMLLGLEPHTKKAAEMMKDLGISAKNGASDSFYQLNGNLKPLPEIIDILNQKFGGLNDSQKQAALATTFTKYGLAGLNVVVGESRDKFLAFQNELKADDAATIAGKKMDNLHGDLLKFNAGVQTMMKSFGDSINGMLRPLVQHASEAVKAITELPKPVKEAGMAFLGIGSAVAMAGGSIIAFAGGVKMLGPTLEMAGMSTAGLEAAAAGLGTAFTTVLIPLAAVVAVAAAVGIGFKLAYDHIKPFHDAVNQVGSSISQAFTKVKSFVQGVFMILSVTGGGKGISILQKLGFSKNTIQELMKMGGQIQATFNGIKTTITTVLNTVGNTVKQALSIIFSGFNSTHLNLKKIVETVWNSMGGVVKTAVSFLVSNIGAAVTTIYNWWNEYWPEIKQIFSVVWSTMKVVLAPILTAISTIITATLGAIKGGWNNGWNAIKAVLKAVWDAISGVVKTAWHLISGIISTGLDLLTGNWGKAWTDIKKTFSNVWNDIKSTFGNLINDALSFGSNFVQMIAKGISGAVGAVTKAVSGVADKIKNFLGFHSPAKEGPAGKGESDVWMKNMMEMFALDIQKHTPKIQSAVNNVALGIKAGFTMPLTQTVNHQMALPSSYGRNGGVTIIVQAQGNITKNEKELGDIVARAFLNKTKMQGKINL